MDLLQAALIFLILLLSIFLAITGFYVFLILRDLKKALDRLNKVLQTTDEIATEIEKPVAVTSNFMTALGRLVKKQSKPKPKRFYKRTL